MVSNLPLVRCAMKRHEFAKVKTFQQHWRWLSKFWCWLFHHALKASQVAKSPLLLGGALNIARPPKYVASIMRTMKQCKSRPSIFSYHRQPMSFTRARVVSWLIQGFLTKGVRGLADISIFDQLAWFQYLHRSLREDIEENALPALLNFVITVRWSRNCSGLR